MVLASIWDLVGANIDADSGGCYFFRGERMAFRENQMEGDVLSSIGWD